MSASSVERIPSRHQPQWVIGKHLAHQIGKRPGGQNPVDMAQLPRLLKYAGIPHKIVSEEHWEEFVASAPVQKILPAPRIDLDHANFKIIWQDSIVKVEFATENGRRHLLVSPTDPIPFEEEAIVKNEVPFVAVQRTVSYVASAFKRVFSTPDYTQSIVNRRNTFSIVLLPAGGQPQETDLLKKDQRTVFLLTQGQFGDYQLPPAPDGALEKEIAISCQNKEETIPELPAEFTIGNWGEVAAFRANAALSMWFNQGLPVAALPNDELYTPPEIPSQQKKVRDDCPFCDDVVIEHESIHLSPEYHNVLFNIFPYIGQKIWEQGTWKKNPDSRHVMVVRKDHGMQKSHVEIFEELRIIARLQDCYKTIYPHTTPINFTQIGVGAGQTLAHPHTHVVAPGEEAAEYMWHLLKEPPICGSSAEWPAPFDHQPSKELAHLYNIGERIHFNASS